jgi:hypothetical protein
MIERKWTFFDVRSGKQQRALWAEQFSDRTDQFISPDGRRKSLVGKRLPYKHITAAPLRGALL